jgi:hypothetical protein
MYHRNILIEQTDPEIFAAIQAENARQEHHIELIASENYASPAVMAAQGSQLTNKYAEGYPGRRYYGGCEHVDVAEQLAIDRATASNPKELPSAQAAVAFWLSKKYSVAPEPLSVLVAQAFEIGQKAKLDPTLILAIMAIESGFNPFAQSPVGAQGLMQVMTKVHHDKYENFGGRLAAFDPVTNLRVGVKVLQECIARAGSIEGGLKYYVGAANLESDGGYADKVMAEHARLMAVATGNRQPPASRFVSAPRPSRVIPASLPAAPAPLEAGEQTPEKVALLGQQQANQVR